VSLAHAKHASRWVTVDRRRAVWTWDVEHGARQLCDVAVGCGTGGLVAIGGDGKLGAMDTAGLYVFDTSTGALTAHQGATSALVVSDDSMLIAAAERGNGFNNLFLIHGQDPRAHEIAMPKRRSPATALAFSADGKQLAAAVDVAIELVATQPPYATERVLEGHQGMITALEYLPDGRLVSTSIDHTVRIWNLADGSVHVLRLPARIATVDVVGDAAVTTSDDHVMRLWDLPSETSRPLLGHDDAPVFAGFTASGAIVGVDHDGRISRYRATTPYGEAALRTWIAVLTNL
jgi:WD40 repeat protein